MHGAWLKSPRQVNTSVWLTAIIEVTRLKGHTSLGYCQYIVYDALQWIYSILQMLPNQGQSLSRIWTETTSLLCVTHDVVEEHAKALNEMRSFLSNRVGRKDKF